jgi:hypothetical protein
VLLLSRGIDHTMLWLSWCYPMWLDVAYSRVDRYHELIDTGTPTSRYPRLHDSVISSFSRNLRWCVCYRKTWCCDILPHQRNHKVCKPLTRDRPDKTSPYLACTPIRKADKHTTADCYFKKYRDARVGRLDKLRLSAWQSSVSAALVARDRRVYNASRRRW